MGDGFNASKVRDEDLRSLAKFGLEGNSILREEIRRNFNDVDRKHDLQVTLLKDAIRHLNSRPD